MSSHEMETSLVRVLFVAGAKHSSPATEAEALETFDTWLEHVTDAAATDTRKQVAHDIRELSSQQIAPNIAGLARIDLHTWHLAIEFAARAAEGK